MAIVGPPHFLVRNQGDDGRQRAEMTRLPRSKLPTDRLYGFPIGHKLDVDMNQVKR
jgi:hypothetical protein